MKEEQLALMDGLRVDPPDIFDQVQNILEDWLEQGLFDEFEFELGLAVWFAKDAILHGVFRDDQYDDVIKCVRIWMERAGIEDDQ